MQSKQLKQYSTYNSTNASTTAVFYF